MTDRLDLASFLVDRGLPEDEVSRAAAAGHHALQHLAFEVLLLGGPARLTPTEVWDSVGADEELARTLWRAMGFAQIPADSRGLGPDDLEALRMVVTLLRTTGVPTETVVRATRLMGQAMSRVADALSNVVTDQLGLGIHGDPHDVAIVGMDMVVPMIEKELGYLFRRHLHAVADRVLDRGDDETLDQVVGFADVVNFTRISGRVPESALSGLLEDFESITTDEVVDHGGRVVKLIGDEVLFAFDDPGDAADLALHLVERFGGDRPELRVGLAMGPVIRRQGDLFGPVVNLASRLVGFARPGTVVASAEIGEALRDLADVVLRPVRTRDLKGMGPTDLVVVRRRRT